MKPEERSVYPKTIWKQRLNVLEAHHHYIISAVNRNTSVVMYNTRPHTRQCITPFCHCALKTLTAAKLLYFVRRCFVFFFALSVCSFSASPIFSRVETNKRKKMSKEQKRQHQTSDYCHCTAERQMTISTAMGEKFPKRSKATKNAKMFLHHIHTRTKKRILWNR